QMLGFHQAAGADVTIATRPVPVERASSFGVLRVDRRGCVAEFAEKPQAPAPMPDTPASALVSMGNYLFSRQALTDALLADARRSTDHDFGRSIIPELVAGGRVYAYDFQTNEVPGVKPYEEPAYWRDVGTIEGYWEAHMDLLGESPRFDLDNRSWPIRSEHHPGPAARFIGGDVDNAQIGEASLVKRATIRNSILGRSVWVNEGAVIEDSIVMDHTTVGKGARLRRAIIDRFNTIPADTEIGIDPAQDRRRFYVDRTGLVAWLDRHRPDVGAKIVAADRASVTARGGHGNAIAQVYNHMIMPLALRRDKVTQVRWGVEDFRARFGREPEGCWLPETAVDNETLEVLAEAGLRFTILAPHQAWRVRPLGAPAWDEVNDRVDTSRAYRWRGPRGLALALSNDGAFLPAHPPTDEVEIHESTSWSCAHGVERWRADCGCRTRSDWQQRWRAPLREALDWLRDQIDPFFEARAGAHLKDPWAARDTYIEVVLDPSPARLDAFFAAHQRTPLDAAARVEIRRLLELARH